MKICELLWEWTRKYTLIKLSNHWWYMICSWSLGFIASHYRVCYVFFAHLWNLVTSQSLIHFKSFSRKIRIKFTKQRPGMRRHFFRLTFYCSRCTTNYDKAASRLHLSAQWMHAKRLHRRRYEVAKFGLIAAIKVLICILCVRSFKQHYFLTRQASCPTQDLRLFGSLEWMPLHFK